LNNNIISLVYQKLPLKEVLVVLFSTEFMAKVDEFDRCIGNSGSYAAVRQRLEEIVVAQQKAYEQLQRSVLQPV